ncbi:MAG: hypothetical protein ACM3NQ_23235 [Bacteroidales bacterium]
MRLASIVVAAGCLLTAAGTQQTKTPGLVGEVREALGGEAALAAVTSFSIDGAGVWFSDSGSIRHSMRIDCQLPDKMVVTRLQSERGTRITERDGVNGTELIRETVVSYYSGPADRDASADTPESKEAERRRRFLRAKQWFAALTMLLFAQTNATHPLQLTDAGTVDLQDAPARLIEGRAADGSVMRLFVSPVTRLPMVVRWLATRQLTALPATKTLMPPAEVDHALASSPVEHELCAGDYKVENAVKWPRVLIEYVGGREIEELTLRSIKLNPKLPADTFQPTK